MENQARKHNTCIDHKSPQIDFDITRETITTVSDNSPTSSPATSFPPISNGSSLTRLDLYPTLDTLELSLICVDMQRLGGSIPNDIDINSSETEVDLGLTQSECVISPYVYEGSTFDLDSRLTYDGDWEATSLIKAGSSVPTISFCPTVPWSHDYSSVGTHAQGYPSFEQGQYAPSKLSTIEQQVIPTSTFMKVDDIYPCSCSLRHDISCSENCLCSGADGNMVLQR